MRESRRTCPPQPVVVLRQVQQRPHQGAVLISAAATAAAAAALMVTAAALSAFGRWPRAKLLPVVGAANSLICGLARAGRHTIRLRCGSAGLRCRLCGAGRRAGLCCLRGSRSRAACAAAVCRARAERRQRAVAQQRRVQALEQAAERAALGLVPARRRRRALGGRAGLVAHVTRSRCFTSAF